MRDPLSDELDALNRARAQRPDDPEVATRWCAAAIRLGQAEKALRYAARLYAGEGEVFRRAHWARIVGQCALRMLRLETAQSAFALGIAHLSEMAEGGRVPPPRAPRGDDALTTDDAMPLLRTTLTRLAAEGIVAFPFAGTLLGLVREGRVLPHDKDLDIAVWLEQHTACCERLLALGWQPHTDMPPYRGFRSFSDPASGITLDIVGLERRSEERIVVTGYELPGYPTQYQSLRRLPWIEAEAHAEPEGTSWRIREPEQVLTAMYGNWQVPNPRWDSMISHQGMDEVTLLVRCYGYDRMLARWSDGQLDRAWAYAHQLLRDPGDLPALRAHRALGMALAQLDPEALKWPEPLR